MAKIKLENIPVLDVINDYDVHDLDFLQKKGDRIFNGEYDITDIPERLLGVPTGTEDIKLINYLGYRPVPLELLKWREIPNVHPDSLDMERWYDELIDYCLDGVFIDGEYWNPLMVYWLNVFLFPVYKIDDEGNTTEDFDPGHPFYCNIDRYIFDILWSCEVQRKNFSLMGPRGFGKMELLDNEILTTEKGYIKFRDLEVGNHVYNKQGDPTEILQIHEHTEKEVYTVTLADGRSKTVCEDHIWGVYDHLKDYNLTERERPTKGRLKSKRGVYTTLTTKELIEEGLTYASKNDSRFFIPMQEAVKSEAVDHVIDPYTLGTSLSDKFIPEEYLEGSIEQRTDLLKGLMDTDGYCSKEGTAQYCTESDKLRDDVVHLCNTLGIQTHVSKKLTSSDFGYAWDITLKTNMPVFHLQRKLDRQKITSGSDWAESTHNRVSIISIEYAGCKDGRCISIDDPDMLYQTGKEHIVTHNSYLIGNVIDREFRLIPNSLSQITSTNEQLTNEAWSKVEQCINAIEVKHRALKHKKITDSLTRKYTGEVIELPDGTTEKRGYLSTIDKIVYGSNAGKTRGSRPDKQLVEEFAAFPPARQKGSLKSCITESKGSWWVGSIKKCITMFTGTGGTVENDEAKDVFLNPRVYNILPTFDHPEGDVEVSISNVPTKKGTGVFIPVHVKWSGTYEATGCPNIKLAEKQIDERRERIRSDPQAYLGEVQEYPKNIKEVFTRNGTNIFNQDKIATQRTNIEFGGDSIPRPGKGYLIWKKAENGRIVGVTWDPAPVNGDVEILEHPHWLQEGSEDQSPMKDLYVAGCDSIDQGSGESATATDNKKGSELAMLVKKRVVDQGYFKHTSNIYVAKYSKRSKSARDDWDNALKIAFYYNSEVNIEYAKISIIGHFRDMGMYHLLKKRPSIALQGADPNKASMLIGTQVSTHLIDHQDSKTKEYIDENYDKIWFPDLLEQLQDYDRTDRTPSDLVVAMGLTEIADEDLMGKVAKPPTKPSEALEMFGYYTDPVTGYKKYGVIPTKGASGQKEMNTLLESEKFKAHGSVRWIDMTDPEGPKNLY